jgi:hypothetical protein
MRNTAHKWSLCSLTGLTLALTVSYLILLFSSGAISQGGREAPGTRFEFALIGDMPYDGRQEKEFANLMREIDAADLAFVVHDGDFWYDGSAWTEQLGGLPPCGDETFKHRLGLAQSSKHPFIFVAGDNEWADCHRAKPRAYDPFERLRGPRAQQAGKLEARLLLSRSEVRTVARAGGNTCGPLSAHVGSLG